jgi:hypothetical protein
MLRERKDTLTERKKLIEAAGAEVEKVLKDKRDTVRLSNDLVQQEEECSRENKEANDIINKEKKKIAALQDDIQRNTKSIEAFVQESKITALQREDAISCLPYPEKDEAIHISPEGL